MKSYSYGMLLVIAVVMVASTLIQTVKADDETFPLNV
jgi:hypothetical protein